jgi:hypothetical protein
MENRRKYIFITALFLASCACAILAATAESTSDTNRNDSRLAVLWTSGDPEVAHRVCLMYTHAAVKNKWFGEVRLIVWGPSARLLAADKDIQAKVKAMMNDGVKVQACIVCADSYGVVDTLRQLDIEVKAMGMPLTEILQSDYEMLTF